MPSNATRHDLHAIAVRAMLERGFQPEPSAAARATLAAIRGPAVADGGTRDLRGRVWCSIDNDDSRDLDQLSTAEPLPDGGTRVLVAVADVAALVKPADAIDDRARHNTTSVYTAGGVFSMLPEKLSTDLTSLNEGQDRVAVVVDMQIDGAGALVGSEVYRASVLNRAKLAYHGVTEWLEGRAAAPTRLGAVAGMEEQLRVQDAVAQRLRQRRHEQGALGLSTSQARAVFDGDLLTDLHVDEPGRGRQLIEELMIAANGVIARFLAARGVPSLRRVLGTPRRWDRIVEMASDLGESLPATPDAVALARFLAARRVADPDDFADLSLAVVKLLGSAEYAVEIPGATPTGHFGLAARDYTHSTAPNRRFPDLITQRLVKAILAEQPAPYSVEELQDLALHCTRKENDAEKVERQIRKSAAALLLAPRLGERFDAVVTGASSKGTWVRIQGPPVEGRVLRGAEGLDVGDRVRVQLLGVDVERGYIDFQAVGRSARSHPASSPAVAGRDAPPTRQR
jgi:exoribonuclease-2